MAGPPIPVQEYTEEPDTGFTEEPDTPPQPSLLRRGVQFITSHPAQTGALALGTAASLATGGMAALPAAGLVGLAGAGGAGAGLAASQLANRDTAPAPTVGGNVKALATEGAGMAAGEGVGRGLVAGAQSVAPWMMKQALSASDALSREFPEMANTAIQHALTVTKGGLDQSRALLSAARQKALSIVAAHPDANTPTVFGHEIASAVGDLYDKLKSRALSDPAKAQLDRLMNKFFASHPNPMSLMDVQQMKETEQALATRAYRALEKGTKVNDIPLQFHQAIARGAREAVEARVPGVADANLTTQQLLGTTRGIEDATERAGGGIAQTATGLGRHGAGAVAGGLLGYGEGGGPGAALGAIGGAALTTPASLSRLSILLSHPVGQAILRQLPKGAASMLTGELSPPSVSSGGPPVP